jgi:hypothetical protein
MTGPQEGPTMTETPSLERRTATIDRYAPLSGVLFAGLTLGGNTLIGPFPESSTPATALPAYYATHADHVLAGGYLALVGSICFAVFGVAVWSRLRARSAPPLVLGAVLVGVAVQTVVALQNAAVCVLLADLGRDPHVDPAALQAWQINASEFGPTAGLGLVLLAIAAAGLLFRLVPGWVAGIALVLGILQFTPVAFLASLLVTALAAVAGVVLTVRPRRQARPQLQTA